MALLGKEPKLSIHRLLRLGRGVGNLRILIILTNEFITMRGSDSLALWGHASTDKDQIGFHCAVLNGGIPVGSQIHHHPEWEEIHQAGKVRKIPISTGRIPLTY